MPSREAGGWTGRCGAYGGLPAERLVPQDGHTEGILVPVACTHSGYVGVSESWWSELGRSRLLALEWRRLTHQHAVAVALCAHVEAAVGVYAGEGEGEEKAPRECYFTIDEDVAVSCIAQSSTLHR